ncbi:hypothetical protein ADL26_18075, partial [Thermoactinomyces vulgaris]
EGVDARGLLVGDDDLEAVDVGRAVPVVVEAGGGELAAGVDDLVGLVAEVGVEFGDLADDEVLGGEHLPGAHAAHRSSIHSGSDDAPDAAGVLRVALAGPLDEFAHPRLVRVLA